MAVALVHFHNLLLGKPACLPVVDDASPPPVTSVDPAKVTCPRCHHYLRHEQATGEIPLRPWGSKAER